MTGALKALRGRPFEQLLWLERSLTRAAQGPQAQSSWTGLAFRLGERWCVTPREEVREVIPPPPMTRVPNAKNWLQGVANVRGGLITVVDLASLLALPTPPAGRGARLLVMNSERMPCGFVVDEVAGYRGFTAADLRRELADEAEPFRPALLGVLVREGEPFLVLSLRKLAASGLLNQAGW